MPAHKYIYKDVLFDDEEEWTVKATRTRYDVYGRPKSFEQRRQELQQRKEQVLESSLEKTRNALRLIKETEESGISSACELQRQGEILKNTNEKLKQMDADLKDSHRHLSGIESVFKSFKNRITGKSKKYRRKKNKQGKAVEESGKTGKGERDRILDDSVRKSGSSTFNSQSTRLRPKEELKDKNAMIEADLEEIADSVTRLKQIGIDMGQEIEKQNELLDVMQLKIETNDIKLTDQTLRIDKLLD